MAEVDILLAAYNGGRFIAEQIDSLFSQTFQDFRLVIRDDGSSYNTPAIIAVCRSPTKNFMELLKHAKADYMMFCAGVYWA